MQTLPNLLTFSTLELHQLDLSKRNYTTCVKSFSHTSLAFTALALCGEFFEYADLIVE